jgi:hypothetical protein
MAKLFGFSIEDSNKKLSKNIISPVPPNNDDGSDHYLTTGFFGSYVDVEGVYRTEFDLIKRYREMALHHEVDSAIEDIVNEAIVSDTNDSPIEIELSNLNASDGIKNAIRQEFKTILEMLDFDKKCHEIFRNWYIDGRLYYHKLIDFKDPHAGIQDIRYVDAMKIRYVRQAKKQKRDILGPKMYGDQGPNEQVFPDLEEYFVYNPKQSYPVGAADMSAGAEKGIKFTKESIAYCTSGLVDRNKGTTLSYLNKAIKILNQLRMIEDSVVIYRLSRSSEKRIFYIDVGNLPKPKAEQYLREMMMRYRNKMNYNNLTGEVDTSRKFVSLMEDFWFPRREGGRGTEVTTLPAGSNLGELTDLDYFKRNLYKALNVPETRIGGDSGFNLGRSTEILRDEVKFTKFVGRLRKRFSQLFMDLLRTQLLLKNIVTPEDWKKMAEHIQFDFLYDNHFAELKESELFTERLNMVSMAEPYVGRYFSQDYLRRKILRQTDEEIVEQDEIMTKEIEDGIIPDPNAPVDPQTGLPIEAGMVPPEGAPGAPQGAPAASNASNNIIGQSGKVPVEPDIKPKEPKMPKGGEI